MGFFYYFFSYLWQQATKETHPSLPTIELATFLAVAHISDGSSALTRVLKELGIVPSNPRKKRAKLESDRIHHSQRKSGDPAKKK